VGDRGNGKEGAGGWFRCVSHRLFSQRARRGREHRTLVTDGGHGTDGTLDSQGDRDFTRSSDCDCN
jgi:hypothetical protein